MHRDPTLFPPPDPESDDDAAGAGASADAADAAERGGVAGHRRLTGHIRATDRGTELTAASLRRIEASPPGLLRDVDSAAAAHRVRMAVWSGIVSGVMGVFIAAVAFQQGWNVGAGLLLGIPVIALVMYLLLASFTDASASAAGTVTSGARQGATPPVRQYSLAESLKMRGDYAAARGEFERLMREDSRDYEAAARLARLWRDELNDAPQAAIGFRRALHVPGLPAGQALLLLRELVEVHVHRLGDPRPAFPELARVARTMPDTPAGAWAAAELARLKADLPRDEDAV